MGKTYYDSTLTDAQIQQVLDAINNILTPSNNGKVLAISGGTLEARSVQWGGGYPEPTGTITLSENGLHDVKDYAEANVQVQGGSIEVIPLSVTANNTYTAPAGKAYSPVTVNVSGGAALPDMDIYGGGLTNGKYIKLYNNSSYAIVPRMAGNEINIDVSQPFEIGISFELNNISSNYSNVSGSSGSFFDTPWSQIQPSNQANTYYCAVPISSNSVIDLAVTSEDVPVAVGNKYTFKMQFTGSEVVFSVTDGSNSKSVSANVSSIHSTSRKWYIGNLVQAGDRVAKDITFDMSHCYLKQNGILVWGRE